jgi:transposase
VDNEVLLYDVTSTYFEGEVAANPQAKRGYSRDHRPDCKQVCIALVVTFDGFPLGCAVFPGNTHDATTVTTIVESMEARHGTVGKVWIMDRGMASVENVAWLRETGRRYILGTPKSELGKWVPTVAGKMHWRAIREGIEVKLCAAPDGAAESFILCRSRDRIEKEKAMHARFSARIEQALTKLQTRIASSQKRLHRDAINRQIGRLLQRNQRAAARFAIELKEADTPAGWVLEVSVQDSFDQWAALSEGAYVLRSNVTEWSDEKLWQAYIQLTQAEAAFRIQKDQLSIRPIWHQREDRVHAYILVCFLAFVLWKTLELWQARAALGNSPRTLLEEFARIQAHDVILPTHTHGEIRLRCVAQPDAAQLALLDRLGIVLPKRIRLPKIAADTTERVAA